MAFYAQLNESNQVFCITQTSSDIEDSSLISLSTYDTSVLGKIWNGTTFEDAPLISEYYYAVIDSRSVVVRIDVSGVEMTSDSLISIPDYDSSLIGMYWNGTTFEVYTLPPAEFTNVDTKLFLSRFTRSEISAMLSNYDSDPIIREIYEYWVNISQNIDVTDSQVTTDLQYLADNGVIASSRVSELSQSFWIDQNNGSVVTP